jgi:hypothetical protein
MLNISKRVLVSNKHTRLNFLVFRNNYLYLQKNVMKKLIVLFCVFGFISCKSSKNMKKFVTQDVEILALGKSKSDLNEKNFETSSVGLIRNKIRVGVSKHSFTKSLFKNYTSQLLVVGMKKKIEYIDSISEKPTYYKVQLLDRVAFIDELNQEYNKSLLSYLKQTEGVYVISNISIVLSEKNIQLINVSDDFYLLTSTNKKAVIHAFKNDVEVGVLDMSLDFVLDYKLSKFCWGKGDSEKPEIFDVINEKEKCSYGTYENANQIVPKTYDFKNY